MVNHAWTKPGEYNITVTASDGHTDATTKKTIEIYPPIDSGKIPQSSNFLLILLALLALMFLLFFLLLGKRRKDEEDEEK
jgi:hypothetical protein